MCTDTWLNGTTRVQTIAWAEPHVCIWADAWEEPHVYRQFLQRNHMCSDTCFCWTTRVHVHRYLLERKHIRVCRDTCLSGTICVHVYRHLLERNHMCACAQTLAWAEPYVCMCIDTCLSGTTCVQTLAWAEPYVCMCTDTCLSGSTRVHVYRHLLQRMLLYLLVEVLIWNFKAHHHIHALSDRTLRKVDSSKPNLLSSALIWPSCEVPYLWLLSSEKWRSELPDFGRNLL
jgi:hypothetical protein